MSRDDGVDPRGLWIKRVMNEKMQMNLEVEYWRSKVSR